VVSEITHWQLVKITDEMWVWVESLSHRHVKQDFKKKYTKWISLLDKPIVNVLSVESEMLLSFALHQLIKSVLDPDRKRKLGITTLVTLM
jgi:hypothetical protein